MRRFFLRARGFEDSNRNQRNQTAAQVLGFVSVRPRDGASSRPQQPEIADLFSGADRSGVVKKIAGKFRVGG
jgi:hypothetical protein